MPIRPCDGLDDYLAPRARHAGARCACAALNQFVMVPRMMTRNQSGSLPARFAEVRFLNLDSFSSISDPPLPKGSTTEPENCPSWAGTGRGAFRPGAMVKSAALAGAIDRTEIAAMPASHSLIRDPFV